MDNYVKVQVVGVLANGVKHVHEMNVDPRHFDPDAKLFCERGVSVSYDTDEVQVDWDGTLKRSTTFTVQWTQTEFVKDPNRLNYGPLLGGTQRNKKTGKRERRK